MPYSLSQIRAQRNKVKRLDEKLRKEVARVPKGKYGPSPIQLHMKACRVSHYETTKAIAQERLGHMESEGLTKRSAKKQDKIKEAVKKKTVALAEKYKAAKAAAAKQVAAEKKKVVKAKKEVAEAKKEVAKAKRIRKPAKKAKAGKA